MQQLSHSEHQLSHSQMDTGSSDLWIPSKQCTTGDCVGKHKYNASSSSTYQENGKEFELEYGVGGVKGFISVDRFCFVKDDLCVPEQKFAEAVSVSEDTLIGDIDGVCGLAFPSLATGGVTPPFYGAMDSLDNPYFTVWFTKQNEGLVNGQITFGDFDPEHCEGPIDWYPITDASFYQIDMDGVSVGDYEWSETKSAASDTGSSFLFGPKDVIDAIPEELGATYNSDTDKYEIGCDAELPDINIIIGGKSYPIAAEDYVIEGNEPKLPIHS